VKLKTLTIGTIALVAVLIAECADTPAGSSPDGGPEVATAEQCEVPSKMDVEYMSYQKAGLIYDLWGYAMTAGCDPVKFDDPVLRITLVVQDALGRRLPPLLDAKETDSPWKSITQIPNYPGRYSISLVVEGQLTRDEVAHGNAEFVGCVVQPRNNTAPAALDVADLQEGQGKATCLVKSE
jgi:hypothetical protein